MIIHKTNVKLPRAPTVRPIIDINKFNVGQDFANLNTLNCEKKEEKNYIFVPTFIIKLLKNKLLQTYFN